MEDGRETGLAVTVQDLVRREFGVGLERCMWEFEAYDQAGCEGHVGLDMRTIWLKYSSENLGRELMSVGAIRFMVTRSDVRGQGIARRLMACAEACAIMMQLPYLILWTDIPGFYDKLGYEHISARAMAKSLPGRGRFPKVEWGVQGGGEW